MQIKLQISLIIFLAYLILGSATIPNYGISWDEPEHYHRGQAYLWYFLTGERTYASLPKYSLKEARVDKDYHQRSIYQSDSLDFNYWIENDGQHPPLNDILASLFNYILYIKLGLVDDVSSYHLFEVLVSAIAVAVVFNFAAQVFNLRVGLLASLFFATSPIFWSESHFNIKDPVQTSFFTLTIYFFWRGISYKNTKDIFLSSLFAAFAFSTKFNILFLPFIITPWLIARQFFVDRETFKFIFSKKFLTVFALFPVVMFGIFSITWPYIWQDAIGNTISVFKYYHNIGVDETKKGILLFGIINPYALTWVVYTTQPLVLLAPIFYLFKTKFSSSKKDVLILWLLWLIIPIIRVSFAKTTIYGGIRQIMEFIPALSLLSAVSFEIFLQNIFRKFKLRTYYNSISFLVLLVLVFLLTGPLYKLHPNENVYFNFISGGLKKNYESNFSSTGITLGNAYRQGVDWINGNALPNSKLALIQGTSVNIPGYWIRSDISYSNFHWSGIKREGEYLMELTHIYDVKVYYYAWEYADKLLEPVYQIKIDNVPLLKIWKNDFDHTKKQYQKNEFIYKGPFNVNVIDHSIVIELKEDVILSRLDLDYSPENLCNPVKYGTVYSSLNGQDWLEEGDKIPNDQLGKGGIPKNSFRFMFAAKDLRFIKIILEPESCALLSPNVTLMILK